MKKASTKESAIFASNIHLRQALILKFVHYIISKIMNDQFHIMLLHCVKVFFMQTYFSTNNELFKIEVLH